MTMSVFSSFSLKRNPLQKFWLLTESMGIARNSVLGTFKAERREGVLWEGAASPSPPARERCKLLQYCKCILDTLTAQKTCLVAANVFNSRFLIWRNPWMPLAESLASAEPRLKNTVMNEEDSNYNLTINEKWKHLKHSSKQNWFKKARMLSILLNRINVFLTVTSANKSGWLLLRWDNTIM